MLPDREREARRTALVTELAVMRAAPRARVDPDAAERELRQRLDDWRGMLCGVRGSAREMLKKLLDGRIAFTPNVATGMCKIHRPGEPMLTMLQVAQGTKCQVSHLPCRRTDPRLRQQRTRQPGDFQ